ncbi:MAG: Ppx/GppA family phosphatase [Synergistaceae bacterium]|nr:Ppx/GppA family phosphatase [Synergistaceae bacterium]
MTKAVIDIGTNSVKYLLAEMDQAKNFISVKDIVSITRLGQGLRKEGRINPPAFSRTAEAVAEFVLDARNNGADEIRIVGTMALRTASNAEDFSDEVMKLTGIEMKVISGKEEAALSFSGAVSGFDLRNVKSFCTFDIGGGSTELVFAEKGKIISSVSIETGALLLTEKNLSMDKVLKKDMERAEDELNQLFDSVKLPFSIGMIIGIGGNVTSMASVFRKLSEYDPEKVHGTELPEEEVERQIKEYSAKSLRERQEIPGLDPKRAEIILAGACILKYIMKFCGSHKIIVSDRGLRHGILYSMAERREYYRK